MWEQIFNLAVQHGLWAVLFLALLIYVLNDSRKREKKYQDTIVNLTKTLGIVQIIKNEVEEIKNLVNCITKKKSNSKKIKIEDQKEEIKEGQDEKV